MRQGTVKLLSVGRRKTRDGLSDIGDYAAMAKSVTSTPKVVNA
jgi:hypothetical protein